MQVYYMNSSNIFDSENRFPLSPLMFFFRSRKCDIAPSGSWCSPASRRYPLMVVNPSEFIHGMDCFWWFLRWFIRMFIHINYDIYILYIYLWVDVVVYVSLLTLLTMEFRWICRLAKNAPAGNHVCGSCAACGLLQVLAMHHFDIVPGSWTFGARKSR